ncbi:MAG: hypothetical protein M5U19_10045 [Microthrixaceae bacterium]|nr:hypothetical protein [Microthrixaceae bacterium]
MADTSELLAEADPSPVLPVPVFTYRSEADKAPGAPVEGMTVSVGSGGASHGMRRAVDGGDGLTVGSI